MASNVDICLLLSSRVFSNINKPGAEWESERLSRLILTCDENDEKSVIEYVAFIILKTWPVPMRELLEKVLLARVVKNKCLDIASQIFMINKHQTSYNSIPSAYYDKLSEMLQKTVDILWQKVGLQTIYANLARRRLAMGLVWKYAQPILVEEKVDPSHLIVVQRLVERFEIGRYSLSSALIQLLDDANIPHPFAAVARVGDVEKRAFPGSLRDWLRECRYAYEDVKFQNHFWGVNDNSIDGLTRISIPFVIEAVLEYIATVGVDDIFRHRDPIVDADLVRNINFQPCFDRYHDGTRSSIQTIAQKLMISYA